MRNTIRPLVSGRHLHVASVVLTLAVLMMPALLVTQTANAQTYSVLYAFTGGTDGANPNGALIQDVAGNLYGTTVERGNSSGCFGYGCGVVFKLDSSGKETVLYTFTGGADGGNPSGALIRDAQGKLYGTAESGGDTNNGTVFKISQSGRETVLHSFTGTDGQYPETGVIRDKAGNFYGTTADGGAYGGGTVFKVDTTGKETVLYSFGGYQGDGTYPAALLMDSAGNLYGTTYVGGGIGGGTVFELNTADQESILFSFRGGGGGYHPSSGLIRHGNGSIYGTTGLGTEHTQGTVYRVSKAGKMKVLYRFSGHQDGGDPEASVVQDKAGNFYGTTTEGGEFRNGTVFKLDPTGKLTVLYSFTGGSDGLMPTDLLLGRDGNLYGTTYAGGSSNCTFGIGGCGVVFKVTP
jgi:uncharacterized repeat protein (TIGR03803 family)